MRVLILNQPFHPDVVATAQIAKDLADELIARGHAVTAIASRSIYGSRGATLPRRETVDGIEVIRVGSNVFGKGTVVGRIVDFAWYYAAVMLRCVFSRRYDVVVCLTTPPFVVLAGVLRRMLRRSRVVYWLMDVYPDVMVAHGMIRERGVINRGLRRLHGWALRRVDATVALGRCMKERLVAQGADEKRIEVVPVWSVSDDEQVDETQREANAYRRAWDVSDRILVMYSGNFGLAHDVETFLDAAERLRDDERFRFAFVGGGKRKPEVDAFVRERGLTNCVLEEYQPRERLAELLGAADVHLVTMLPEWWGLVTPSKFYGVAGAARATVFIGPSQSEIARCVREWDCGVRVAPGDVDGLVAALDELAKDRERLVEMGRRASAHSTRAASRGACAGRIIELIEGAEPESRAVGEGAVGGHAGDAAEVGASSGRVE